MLTSTATLAVGDRKLSRHSAQQRWSTMESHCGRLRSVSSDVSGSVGHAVSTPRTIWKSPLCVHKPQSKWCLERYDCCLKTNVYKLSTFIYEHKTVFFININILYRHHRHIHHDLCTPRSAQRTPRRPGHSCPPCCCPS